MELKGFQKYSEVQKVAQYAQDRNLNDFWLLQ